MIPHHVVATLQALARFRLDASDTRTPPADLSGRPDIDLSEAVAKLRRWLAAQPRNEPKTLEFGWTTRYARGPLRWQFRDAARL